MVPFLLRHGGVALGLLALGCAADATLLSAAPAPDSRLSELSPPEREQLCASETQWLSSRAMDPRFKHAWCLFGGAFEASLADALANTGSPQQICQTSYDTCIHSDLTAQSAVQDAGESSPPDSSLDCSEQAFAGCSARAKDWRVCIESGYQALADTFAKLTCASPAIASPSQPSTTASNPLVTDGCRALAARCPSLSALAPTPEPPCSLELETTGAFSVQVSGPIRACGWSSSSSDTIVEVSFVPADGELFSSFGVRIDRRVAGVAEQAASVGVIAWAPDIRSSWRADDGCSADIETTACKGPNQVPGVRYRVANGTCGVPAMPSGINPAGDLQVVSFAGLSACVDD